jgi:hypothetical protein
MQIGNWLEPLNKPSEKLRDLPFEMVFGTSGVSANPRLEIENLFSRCSAQEQNSAATSIVKIPHVLNHFGMVRKLVELPIFLVFNFGTNSFGNGSVFAFYLLLSALYKFPYLFLSFGYGVSDISMSAFQMDLNDYPHFNLAEDGRLCSTG